MSPLYLTTIRQSKKYSLYRALLELRTPRFLGRIPYCICKLSPINTVTISTNNTAANNNNSNCNNNNIVRNQDKELETFPLKWKILRVTPCSPDWLTSRHNFTYTNWKRIPNHCCHDSNSHPEHYAIFNKKSVPLQFYKSVSMTVLLSVASCIFCSQTVPL